MFRKQKKNTTKSLNYHRLGAHSVRTGLGVYDLYLFQNLEGNYNHPHFIGSEAKAQKVHRLDLGHSVKQGFKPMCVCFQVLQFHMPSIVQMCFILVGSN